MVVIGKKLLYSGKVVVHGQNGFIRANWFYSVKVVVFRQKWLYPDKVVVFGKVVVFVKKWLFLCKSCCFRTKWSYSGINGCSDWVCTAVMSNDVMKDLRG